MPTKIIKTTERQTLGNYRGSGKGERPIVVSIRKGDVIALRFLGMRTEYPAEISALMTWLQGKSAGVSIEPRKKRTNL